VFALAAAAVGAALLRTRAAAPAETEAVLEAA
jgi:hypothetical protein